MEELFSREAKEGWRLAADAARSTDERASSEDRKPHVGWSVYCSRWQLISPQPTRVESPRLQ